MKSVFFAPKCIEIGLDLSLTYTNKKVLEKMSVFTICTSDSIQGT